VGDQIGLDRLIPQPLHFRRHRCGGGQHRNRLDGRTGRLRHRYRLLRLSQRLRHQRHRRDTEHGRGDRHQRPRPAPRGAHRAGRQHGGFVRQLAHDARGQVTGQVVGAAQRVSDQPVGEPAALQLLVAHQRTEHRIRTTRFDIPVKQG